DSILINQQPYVNFTISDSCFVEGEAISFISDTLASDSVVQWNWLFDGFIASTDQNPQRVYSSQGEKTIALTLTTNKGCTRSISRNKFIGIKTTPEFEWRNECFGETVNFDIITETDAGNIVGFEWDFGDGSSLTISDTTETSNHYYSSPGDYLVKLVEITKTCGSELVENVVPVRPKVILSDNEYFQDFESGTTEGEGWVAEDLIGTSNNTWQYGIPSGDKISGASTGDYAWVTSLNGNYGNNEKSAVTSPCFDFTSMEKPMLRLDFISATEKDRDGAVIQYTNAEGDWTTLGLPDQGVNWYNSVFISGAPAGQTFGWTGDGNANNGNNEWRTAMFWLDQLTGREGVRFRIVFGSDAAATDEGFGFDNIWFGERKRIVLLENFTNSSDEQSAQMNDNVISPIIQNNPLDVIAVNYHTSFPGNDKMNTFYASGPSARTLYYGISKVPYSILDGGERQYSYSFTDYLEENDLKARMLIEPKFDVIVKQDIQDNKLVVSSTLKAIESIPNTNVISHVAIIEKTVVDGAETYSNVLRTMLPDAAGTLIEKDWNIGDSAKVYQTWDIPEGVYQDSLIAVVFVQDKDTKEVYQTAYTEELSTITAIGDLFLHGNEIDYLIYPNPASEQIMIKLTQTLNYDLSVQIYNNTGVLVNSGVIQKGADYLEMNVENFPIGVYYVKITDNVSNVMIKKIIINN
ncbi:MAG: PKD domain-containing protein, partial [Bacteroidota bacterium]